MSPEELAEERRAFYVAMTRARTELVLATLGAPEEFASEIEAPVIDLRTIAARVPTAHARYMDCDPSDVVMTNAALARAQGAISRLREGDALRIDADAPKVRLYDRQEELVAILSAAGQQQFDVLRASVGAPVKAWVHEIYVHLERDKDGNVAKRWLVTIPRIRFGG
jgi:ATP-dependent exoDNAse (exonuclease V) beta subunit